MPRLFNWAWFIAAIAPSVSADFVSTDYDGYNEGDLGHRPHLEFQSSTEFAPVLQANIWNYSAISSTGSHIFLKHDGNDTIPLSSPLILDSRDLSAIYMNRTFENVFGTRIQGHLGRKYLTFWEGQKGDGIGDGYGLVFDDTYRLVHKVSAQNLRVHSDLHEFALTEDGTALVTGVDRKLIHGSEYDRAWDIPRSLSILDAAFQEIDLETNEVLFDWRALQHINPMESFEPRASGWDAYHMNSIEKTKAGNYLISIRHTHSILLIDGQTGDIIWTLGGRQNDFVELPGRNGTEDMEPVLSMAWQHHARFVPGTDETQITLFDNHVKVTTHGECDSECSRGIHFAINDKVSPPTVQLLGEFQHPTRLQAQSQGSVQVLGDGTGTEDLGNVFIGWGRCPTFTEHSATGETVMDVQFSPWHSRDIPDALDNYRAYKMDWVATPWWDPSIAPKNGSNGELLAYVSWNGATEVAKWVVRGIQEGGVLNSEGTVLATSKRTGFETKLVLVEAGGEKNWQYVWAEALDSHDNVLRKSEVVEIKPEELVVAVDTFDEFDTTFAHILAAAEQESAITTTITTTTASATATATTSTTTTTTTTAAATATTTESAPATATPTQRSSPEEKHSGLSKTVLVLLATGLGVAGMALIAAGVFWWYRRRNYNRLDAGDFAMESDKFALDSADEYSDSDYDDDEGRPAAGYDRPAGDDEESQALVPKQHAKQPR
ncbi:uncharacterized protein N7483_008743 [Penicillium malachiteum]|uniref:uncharacterized protein n=1 Tax=Penicillium malachiteum TaxID=1324776 RepID=UPI0025474E0F|nr:uncharacterized protein N7483_008743 [Penicillium malachiteum]KAJ5720809.1 hypothetical protein N7483_008743 [Penicillium malachiteum]